MMEETMNDECSMMNEDVVTISTPVLRYSQEPGVGCKLPGSCEYLRTGVARTAIAFRRMLFLLLFSSFIIHLSSFPAHATPTQEDVFKSIQSNENDQIDGRKVLAFFAAAGGVVIMILLINKRQQREERPKTLNHQAKLLKELMKSAGLKSSQVRQLKMLSADLRAGGEPVENLVTLLLCPSLIQKARQDDRGPKQ